MSRQGLPDYLLMFRKNEDDEFEIDPILHNGGFDFYIGENAPTVGDAKAFSIEVWNRYASPVWYDISASRVLRSQKAKNDEKHISLLQLDVIERAIHLWSNPGDIVFSPFAGIGSEGYGAIRLGRKFTGIELKPEYFDQAVRNVGDAENDLQQPTLF